MSALPAELYRDPAVVVAEIEDGNVLPEDDGAYLDCQGCRHLRPAVASWGGLRWPCARGNTPRPFTGGCACRNR